MTRTHYQFGHHGISKDDIAMNLATDGFRFVAFEQNWDLAQATQLFDQLGDIENKLSEEDCCEFLSGLQNSLHDSELLYEHVTNFTRKMLHKWQLVELTRVANDENPA
ncbi:MAG: hypothetical protein OEZ68_01330 [Gammaproteobacteria bacterium]|nr:hypothetical protein [Gammaproteobacteria bacterium]MDH5799421.1 hypothetical protein [Gammaproteobacteria bacterium]